MAMSQNHTNPIISQVQLGNTLYDIHDQNAIHTLADLGLTDAMHFKGAVANLDSLPATGEPGDIYHVIDRDSEYIWVTDDNPAVEGHWEEFGSKFVVDHIHPATLTGTGTGTAAAQTWTQKTGTVTGTAAAQTWTQKTGTVAVTGHNDESTVTGSTKVAVTTPTHKYLTASLAATPTFTPTTDDVLGADTTFTASGVAVGISKTAKAITGFGTHPTTQAISELNSTTVQEVKSITNGTAAQWGATVNDGILSFSWTTNTPTAVTKGASANLATPTPKTMATAITGLGTATTADCATEINVTSQPTITVGTNDVVAAAISGTVSKPGVTLTKNNSTVTGAIQYTETTTDADVDRSLNNGKAAAQVWTMDTGSATVTGTNAQSNVTGSATVTGTNEASSVSVNVSVTGTTGTAQEYNS